MKRKISKKQRLTLILVACVVVGGTAIFGVNQVQNHAQEQQNALRALDNIEVEKYMPFDENADIVRLPKEAGLRLTEDLPVLDGAAALLPVYAAFTNAVYPSDIELLWPKTDQSLCPFLYSNTIDGYLYLTEGRGDIFFGVEPSAQQRSDFAAQNKEPELTTIGHEGFVFFVNQKNQVDNLTQEQLRDIYSGKITNWKEVGGKNMKIVAYQRNPGSGSQTALENFMGTHPLEEAPTERIVDLMSGIIEQVADYKNHPGAIGFSFRYYTKDVVGSQNIKLLSVDSVKPTLENIGNNTYPLVKDIYAVTVKGNPNPNVQKMLDWVLSEEGQYIVEKTGYSPVKAN